MIKSDRILKGYRITEKATVLSSDLNQYTFEVYPDANRTQVAQAIEQTFSVSVAKVNMLNQKPKKVRNRINRGSFGYKSAVKKVIVTLKEGDKIELA